MLTVQAKTKKKEGKKDDRDNSLNRTGEQGMNERVK